MFDVEVRPRSSLLERKHFGLWCVHTRLRERLRERLPRTFGCGGGPKLELRGWHDAIVIALRIAVKKLQLQAAVFVPFACASEAESGR
jgi:hypothetical protein